MGFIVVFVTAVCVLFLINLFRVLEMIGSASL